ncbi:MAG: phosphatidylglycerophosphatase A [Spirochaetes bacterium]|nr:phosphatidylglycerophosphatase A [Spirochaetota bacterium]
MSPRLTRWIATGFGSGLLKPASGTWGTAAAMPVPVLLGLLVPAPWSQLALFVIAAAVFYFGLRITTEAEALFGEKDPHPVVLDEFVGCWISVLGVPFQFRPREIALFCVAFLLFRAFDVVKPFGIRRLQAFPGGLGIMIDDAAAGALTLAGTMLVAGALDHTGFW